MSNSTPTHTAFRYMTRFHCIGGDCEASCCTGGWSIGIDREHYDRAKSAMGTHPTTRQEFDAKVKRVKGVAQQKTRQHALMVLQSDGSCGFFGADRMCSMQQRYGETVLPDTCAIYPRSLSMSGERRELAGMTSCPEVARQLLLYEDALDLVEVTPEQVGRDRIYQRLEARPQKPYLRFHDELRNLMLDLLSDPLYPLRSRLSFMAYFGYRTQSFLNAKTGELDEERLLAEVERIQDPAMRAELHRQFGQLEVDPVFATRLVVALLKARSSIAGFDQLLRGVMESYAPAGSLGPDQSPERAPVQAIVQAYLAQKQHWAPFEDRIDGYFANYAKNYWAREWYARSADLLTHSIQLLARIATLRFLLLGHPSLVSAAQLSHPERALALDQAVVATVQKFSRAFEHDHNFTKHLMEQLAASNLVTLAHATCLATF